MRVYYTDEKGMRKPVWFGSYGIGSTRVMGTWVEVSHDERGIIWNKTIAPFDVHLLDIRTNDKGQRAKEIYQKLEDSGIEALWDDRNVGAGEKFADADLIGIPVRLVTSEKTKDKIEWKSRASEKTELLTIDQVIEAITKSRL